MRHIHRDPMHFSQEITKEANEIEQCSIASARSSIVTKINELYHCDDTIHTTGNDSRIEKPNGPKIRKKGVM